MAAARNPYVNGARMYHPAHVIVVIARFVSAIFAAQELVPHANDEFLERDPPPVCTP